MCMRSSLWMFHFLIKDFIVFKLATPLPNTRGIIIKLKHSNAKLVVVHELLCQSWWYRKDFPGVIAYNLPQHANTHNLYMEAWLKPCYTCQCVDWAFTFLSHPMRRANAMNRWRSLKLCNSSIELSGNCGLGLTGAFSFLQVKKSELWIGYTISPWCASHKLQSNEVPRDRWIHSNGTIVHSKVLRFSTPHSEYLVAANLPLSIRQYCLNMTRCSKRLH